jgi:hypothetical protein
MLGSIAWVGDMPGGTATKFHTRVVTKSATEE